jgi:hypothetical protein
MSDINTNIHVVGSKGAMGKKKTKVYLIPQLLTVIYPSSIKVGNLRCNGEIIIMLSMAQVQLYSEALCEYSGYGNTST